MAVIDASVYYITLVNAQDRDHASSWVWFEQAPAAQEPIVAPVMLLAEAAAALGRRIGDLRLARRVVRQLRDSEGIELLPVTLPLAERAATIAADHRTRGCDALYVALADQLRDRLITLDRRRLERSGALVVAVQPWRRLRVSCQPEGVRSYVD